jgi:hypothetical protein
MRDWKNPHGSGGLRLILRGEELGPAAEPV